MAHFIEPILEPLAHTQSAHRRGFGKLFMGVVNKWLSVPADKMELIQDIGSLLHDLILMIDDIQDGSPLRRGQPAAHKVYGEAQTICAVNFTFFRCYEKIIASRSNDTQAHLDLFAILVDEFTLGFRGQGLEILWRDNLFCPSEEEYISMVILKTGFGLRIIVRFMMVFATTNRDVDYMPLCNLMATFFQIRDDYLNLQSPEYTANKGFAEDLTEGKFSFPVVHSIRADQTNRQVLDVLQERPSTPTLKVKTIEYMRNRTRSMDYTLAVLDTLGREIHKEIGRLGGSAILESFMDGVHLKQDYMC